MIRSLWDVEEKPRQRSHRSTILVIVVLLLLAAWGLIGAAQTPPQLEIWSPVVLTIAGLYFVYGLVRLIIRR